MKIKLFVLGLLTGFTAIMASCQSDGVKRTEGLAPNAQQVTAEEVIQTSMYTYVRVADGEKDYWVAINKAEVELDKTYYWSAGAEMRNFTSKELNRTFPSIMFVSDFTDQPITTVVAAPPQQMPAGETMAGKPQAPQQEGIKVEKAKGGLTIAEVFAKKTSLDGKSIRVRAQVVKFAPMIMNRNWVHLQDGTKDGSNFDLTVTTQDIIKVGEVVTFEGIVGLNKDFGAGYFYEVILENGKLVQE
jgi:hypothetical protein